MIQLSHLHDNLEKLFVKGNILQVFKYICIISIP